MGSTPGPAAKYDEEEEVENANKLREGHQTSRAKRPRLQQKQQNTIPKHI